MLVVHRIRRSDRVALNHPLAAESREYVDDVVGNTVQVKVHADTLTILRSRRRGCCKAMGVTGADRAGVGSLRSNKAIVQSSTSEIGCRQVLEQRQRNRVKRSIDDV